MNLTKTAITILLISSLFCLGTAQTQTDNGLEYRLGFTDTITEKKEITTCSRYDNVTDECLDKNTENISGEHRYVFDWDQVDVYETDNDNIKVSAVLKPNKITRIIHKSSKPALTDQEALKKLNKNWYWNGGKFDEDSLKQLRETAQNPSIKLQGVESDFTTTQINSKESFLSNSGKIDFSVIRNEDEKRLLIKVGKNSGTILINDESGFENNTNLGRGVTPNRKGDSSYSSAGFALIDTLGIGYLSGRKFDNSIFSNSPIEQANGPAYHYRYEADEGFSTVFDYSANGLDGIVDGDPVAVDGVWDTKGFAFDGVDDTIEANQYDSDNSHTISTWFKKDTTGGLIIANRPASGNSGTWFGLDNDKFKCFMRTANSGESLDAGTSISVSDGAWHHGVCRYDESNGELDAFVDGSLEASDTEQDPGGNDWTSGAPYYIASREGQEDFLNVSVDETMFFNRSLTNTEIQSYLWMGNGNSGASNVQPTEFSWESIGLDDGQPSQDKDWTSADITYLRPAATDTVDVEFTTETDGFGNPDFSQGVSKSLSTTTGGTETSTVDLSSLSNNEEIFVNAIIENSGDPRFSALISSIETSWNDPITVGNFLNVNPADNSQFTTYENLETDIDFFYDFNKTTNNDVAVSTDLDGSQVYSDTQSQSFKTHSHTESLGAGTYSWFAEAEDTSTNDVVNTSVRSFEIVEETGVFVDSYSPSGGEEFTENDVIGFDANVDNDRPNDVVVEQFVENQDTAQTTKLNEETVGSNSVATVSSSQQLDPSNYTYIIEVYDQNDNLLTSNTSGEFEVINTPVKIDVVNPENGKEYIVSQGGSVSFNYEWDVTSNETGSGVYLDEQANYQVLGSHPGDGSTVTYSDSETLSAGTYEWRAGFSNTSSSPPEYETNNITFFVSNEATPDISFIEPNQSQTYSTQDNETSIFFEWEINSNFNGTYKLTIEDTTTNNDLGVFESGNHTTGIKTYNTSATLDSGKNYTATASITSNETSDTYDSTVDFSIEQTKSTDTGSGLLNQITSWIADIFGVSDASGAAIFGLILSIIMSFLTVLPFMYFGLDFSSQIFIVAFLVWSITFTVAGLIPGFYSFILIVLTAVIVADKITDLINS